MRKLAKKLLPEKLQNNMRNLIRRRNLNELNNFDKDRFIKHAYYLSTKPSLDNLRSKITTSYHSIEKGLSNKNIRYKFGNRAFTQLFTSMDMLITLGYPTSDSRFQQAITVIKAYVNLHKQNNIEINEVEEKLNQYLPYLLPETNYQGGSGTLIKSELPDYKNISFDELNSRRYSVRDFGEHEISKEDVLQSIQMSTKTPSTCNRQSWRVHYIVEPELISKMLRVQKGLNTHGENIRGLLLVTCSKEYMGNAPERNQSYIDGGLFTMNLVYSLTTKNIATCLLNAAFNIEQERNTRNLLDIHESEDLICFIGLGSFPDNIKYAKSPRDHYSNFTTIY